MIKLYVNLRSIFIIFIWNVFQNIALSHKILLTIPITVTGAERSISKLKLI